MNPKGYSIEIRFDFEAHNLKSYKKSFRLEIVFYYLFNSYAIYNADACVQILHLNPLEWLIHHTNQKQRLFYYLLIILPQWNMAYFSSLE